jgi:hypothetical protein
VNVGLTQARSKMGTSVYFGRSGKIATEHKVTPNEAMRSATLAGRFGHSCGCGARLAVPYCLAAGAAIYVASKFSTLIGDVATNENSGSGVFDPDRICLVGTMSRKFTSHMPEGDRDDAKFFSGNSPIFAGEIP